MFFQLALHQSSDFTDVGSQMTSNQYTVNICYMRATPLYEEPGEQFISDPFSLLSLKIYPHKIPRDDIDPEGNPWVLCVKSGKVYKVINQYYKKC